MVLLESVCKCDSSRLYSASSKKMQVGVSRFLFLCFYLVSLCSVWENCWFRNCVWIRLKFASGSVCQLTGGGLSGVGV